MKIDWEDIKRRRAATGIIELVASIRWDRVRMTPNGPVAFLRKGEELIELSYREIIPAGSPVPAPGAPGPPAHEPPENTESDKC